jgi:DNA repair exonuclease SbcCD nuclease subunit
MKVIITSCSHIGKHLAGYDWREDQIKAFDEIVERSHRADLFVHLGDLFDNGHPAPKDYALALDLLDAIDCPMFLMKGNHDENPGMEPDALEPISRFRFRKDLSIIRRPTMVGIGGKFFAFIPFQNDAKERAASGGAVSAQAAADFVLDGCRRGEPKISMLFTHVDIGGLLPQVGDSSQRVNVQVPLGDLQALPFDVAVGHYHKSAHLAPNIYVVGSLLPFDFGEVGEQKFMLTAEL